jgi:hypothetical protein
MDCPAVADAGPAGLTVSLPATAMPIRSRYSLTAARAGMSEDRQMNDLKRYSTLLDEITPWSGTIPAGFTVDFLGTLTSKDFLVWGYHPAFVDGRQFTVPLPRLYGGENGEF